MVHHETTPAAPLVWRGGSCQLPRLAPLTSVSGCKVCKECCCWCCSCQLQTAEGCEDILQPLLASILPLLDWACHCLQGASGAAPSSAEVAKAQKQRSGQGGVPVLAALNSVALTPEQVGHRDPKERGHGLGPVARSCQEAALLEPCPMQHLLAGSPPPPMAS